MRISGSSPLGRRSTHTPRHLPNPSTAGRGVTQAHGTITYHYPSGRTVSHFDHAAWARHRAGVVAAHKRARERKLYAKQPSVKHGYHPGASERTGLALAHVAAARALAEVSARGGLRTPNVFYQRPLANPLAIAQNQAAGRVLGARIHLDNRLRQRPLDASIRAQARALWKVVHKDYGGKMPRVTVSKGLPGGGAGGWVAFDHPNLVHIAREYNQRASSADPRVRAILERELLHEWAHVRQPITSRSSRPRQYIEGGAEAFQRHVAAKHHLAGGPLGAKPWAYEPYVRWLRAHKGPSYIRRGQFKRP